MKKFLLFLKCVIQSLFAGFIAYVVILVICNGYADALKSERGVVLSSELTELKIAPYLAGIVFFFFWLQMSSKDIEK